MDNQLTRVRPFLEPETEKKPRKTYFREITSPVELLNTENITYTPKTEVLSASLSIRPTNLTIIEEERAF